MAPRAPTGRPKLIAMLRASAEPFVPIGIGNPSLLVAVVREDGVWRLRRLEHSAEGFAEVVERQRSAGRALFPEHLDTLSVRRPSGEVLAEAADLDAFIAALDGLDWPANW